MKRFPHLRPLLVATASLFGLLGLVAFGVTSTTERSGLDARAEVQAAWARARESGAYHFIADITQQNIPLPTVTNAGQRSRTDELHLEGRADLSAQRMLLKLWAAGADGVEVRVEGDQAFVRRGENDKWEPVPGFTGAFAPEGDFLAFLAAAEDITRLGVETRAGVTFTRYTFRVNGPGFAAYVRDQMEKHLAERGELPLGVSLDLPRAYVGMRGAGEVWVGSDGLPLRQSLKLQFPPQNDQRLEANIEVSFSDFGSGIEAASLTLSQQFFSAERLTGMMLVGAMLLPMAFIITHRRSRVVNTSLTLAVILSMVVTPLLQSHHVAAFTGELRAQAQTQAQAQQALEAQSQLQAAVSASGFNPNTDPLAFAENRMEIVSASAQAAIADTNLCRLADDQLAPDNPADTDLDGLTDYQECLLGTSALFPDSDGDTLADTVEVRGFRYAGKTWYTDPLEFDSNRDGLGDVQEWLADLNNDNQPDDTDGDNTPDLFDDDNDGDGVLDKIDLSPFQATARVDAAGAIASATHTFGDAAPFALAVTGLQANQPTYVEFQIRPADPNHLWYAFNVLDWPQGDEAGQMQDTDGQTFADVAAAAKESYTNTDANGDLKLIPMLEIRITGEADNLPPASELEPYSIFAQIVNEATKEKAVYVPLQLVNDAHSGARQAFYGKMLYQPGAQWGNPHQVRLAWVIQALVDDACVEEDAQGECLRRENNQRQVIYVYYDEWFLTGLNVREDHGADIAIIYEDPALDADLDADTGLIGLAAVLDNTFLVGSDCPLAAAGRDCGAGAGDGHRDYVVVRHDPNATSRELGEVFDHQNNGGAAIVEPWGLPNSLRVVSKAYRHVEAALVATAMTETKAILNSAFDPVAPVTPTLMFAREERARTINLEELGVSGAVTWRGEQLNLDINTNPAPNQPGGRAVETIAALSWAAYRQVGGEWEALPREAYWAELVRRYAAPGEDIEAGEFFGGLLALGAYYLGLFNGVLNTVQIGSNLTIPSTQSLSDTALKNILARLYNAPGGQGIEFTANFVLSLMFPTIPEQQVLQIVATKFSTADPEVWNDKFIKEYFAQAKATIRTADRLGVASSVIGAIGFMLAAANLGLIIVKEAIGAPKGSPLDIASLSLNLAVQTLNAVSTGLSVAQSVLTKALELGTKAAAVKSVLGSVNLTKANVGAAVVGLVIAIGVIWGVFIHTVVSNNIQTGTPQFNTLLAGAIAATLIAVLFFVLSLTTVGLILVALIGVIDAIMALLCGLGVSGTCTGFTAWLTEQVAKLIYGYNAVLTVEVKDTEFGPLDANLLTPELGLRAGNALVLQTTVTTTLAHKDPEDSFFDTGTLADGLVFWAESELQTSKFNYAYNARPADAATTWSTYFDHTYQYRNKFGSVIFEQAMYQGRTPATTLVGQIPLEAGINLEPVFLVASYDLPGVECERWVNYSDCDSKRVTGASVNGLDIVLDVFPADVTAFYGLNWGRWTQLRENYVSGSGFYTREGHLEFGLQRDYDGDGLLASDFGGNDPDDARWDTDGDGLSDAYELTRSASGLALSATDDDSDGDCQLTFNVCLTDGEEERLGTNPAQLDSDGDGLFDKEEIDGWTFTLGGLVTRATSDPLNADTDGDGMDDKAERDLHRAGAAKYPYHPRAFNDHPLALTTSLDGVNVVASEGQTFVAPLSQLAYATTVRNNLSADLYAQGALTVAIPPAIGGQTQTYLLDYFGGDERSFHANVIVPADAPSQRADITNDVSAQLPPDNTPPSYLIRNVADSNFSTNTTRPRQWSLATAPWGDTYATAVVEGEDRPSTGARQAFVIFRAQRSSEIVIQLDEITNNFLLSAGEEQFADMFSVDLACANNGNCMVVWVKYFVGASGRDHQDVRGAIVLNDGRTVLGPFTVGGLNDTPDNPEDQVHPIIATDGVNFMVAWLHESNITANNLDARRFGNSGEPLGLEFAAINHSRDNRQARNLDIAYSGGDSYLLVWNERRGNDMALFHRTLNSDGPSLDPPALVRQFSSTGLHSLTVAYDTTGATGGLVSYVNNPTDPTLSITSIPPAGQFSCTRAIPAETAPGVTIRAAFSASGNWVLAYTDKPSVPANANVRINYQLFAPDCGPRGNPETYTATGIRPDALGLACRGDQCALTTSLAATSTTNRVFQRRFEVVTVLPVGPTLSQRKVDAVKVDSDPPTSAFDGITYTLAAQNTDSVFIVSGAADDSKSGSGIERVEVSRDGGATWEAATGCEAWAYGFAVPAGAGTYTLQVRAVDLLGHIQPAPGTTTINVVGAAPELDTAIADDTFLRPTFDEADARWVVALSGSVRDTGSGLSSVEVNLTPNSGGWQTAKVDMTAGTWAIDYSLAAFDSDGSALLDPSGEYTFTVRAADAVGNVTPENQYLTRRVRLDAAPPLAQLTTIGGQPVSAVSMISGTVELNGVVEDPANPGSGVASLELSFTDRQPPAPTQNWQPVTVEPSDAGVLSANWTINVPSDLEGFYQIDARGMDAVGNLNQTAAAWGQWQGEVDTLAPRLSFSAAHLGAGSTARTHYELTATDLNLSEAGIEFPPCAGRGRVERRYYDSEWYRANNGDPTRLYEITHTCVNRGYETAPVTVTACDSFAHCASTTTTPSFSLLGAVGGKSRLAQPIVPVELDAVIFEPEDGSVLTSTGPITVSGGAYAPDRLQSLTLTVDGAAIFSQTWAQAEAVTDMPWSASWTPFGEGQHSLVVTVNDWAGREFASEPIVVTLNTGAPTVTIADTLITTADLITGSRADLTGTATDLVGVAKVEVSIDGGPWQATALEPAGPGAVTWRFPWALSPSADGVYTVTARATNLAGNMTEAIAAVVVDLTPPDPVTVTLTYVDNTGVTQPLASGQTIRDALTLVVNWTASADANGLGSYLVGWTESATPDAATLTPYASAGQPHTQAAGEARAVYARVVAQDANGNRTWQTLGPVYVDAATTPDYIADLGYRGWTESACAQVGADREVSRNAPPGASLNAIQRFHATWNESTLRLTWSGANWDADGDLFVYLDTTSGGATGAFNPYPATNPTIGLPASLAADYLIWVEDGSTASLQGWTGTGWATVTAWAAAAPYFQLDTRPGQPHTDIVIPFAMLGNPTALRLVALASEEEALRLWATMPDKNPLNSPRVISAAAASLDVTHFDLTQDYGWSSLGAGQCPNAGQFADADVHVNLNAEPGGVTASFLGDDWLTLRPGARLDADDDGLPDMALPTIAPFPVGVGQTITYTLIYANEGTAAASVRVTLAAYGALQLNGGDVIDLGTLAPGEIGTVTFSAQVVAGAGERSAELNAIVSDDVHGDFDWLWALHPVDRDPPANLAIRTPVDYVRSGPTIVSGVAQDAAGLREVQLAVQPLPSGAPSTLTCPDDSPRDGEWTCAWDAAAAPGVTAFQLRAQATDVFGNLSGESAPVTVQLDDTPPTVSLDSVALQALADGILTPGEFLFSGQVQDNARASAARVCLEREAGPSCTEVAVHPGNASSGAWAYALPVFESDGVVETISIYGRDAAGNLSSAPLRQTFEVDNRGPLALITTTRRAVLLSDYLIGGGPALPVLAGTASDANGVKAITVTMQTPGKPLLTLTADRAGEGWSFTPRFANDPGSLGEYTLRLYTEDQAGNVRGFGPFALRVVVSNAAPVVDAGPPQTTFEGSVVNLTSTFTDADAVDGHTAAINWGDGSPVEAGLVAESATPSGMNGSVTGSHVYADNGAFTVVVCVTDDVGAVACGEVIITANNAAPTLTAGPDQTANAGDPVALTPATFSDPGTLDTHTATISWGDGTPAEAASITESPFGPPGSTTGATGAASGSHRYDDSGVYTVEICVADDDGGRACDTFIATITNTAPTVNAGPDQTTEEGVAVSLAPATFTDPNSLDTHTAIINWGDGTPAMVGLVAESSDPTTGVSGSVSGSHVFAKEGVYTVEVCVSDDEGATGCDTLTVKVDKAPTENHPPRDTRSWTRNGVKITFSTPEHYSSCAQHRTFDRIWTEGLPRNWRLRGWVKVEYTTDNGRRLIEKYAINQRGNLNLQVLYPPASAWPVLKDGMTEIHVDLSIYVYDASGNQVKWVGGDPRRAPGALGPGQDWDVFCRRRIR
jgi:hypothetical protein